MENMRLFNVKKIITNEKGGNSTIEGVLPTSFNYEGYAARLLTVQEVNNACGITVELGGFNKLDSCNYLMENTTYSYDSYNVGYWLESPSAVTSDYVWLVNGNEHNVGRSVPSSNTYHGIRPVIEVLKSEISY